jgi:tRNA modification GTPase
MTTSDTIYAVASGSGVSGVAVVRLSGVKSLSVLDALTGSRAPEARRFSLRRIYDPGGRHILDVAGVLWLPGPASFTGEDCAELHLHGSLAVVSAVLSALSGMIGLRMAEPGEFTRRALSNGKLDLVEVEGLGDLLAARTEVQRRVAMDQVIGRLSGAAEAWRSRLVDIRALVEAAIDFVDEEGVAEAAVRRIDGELESLRSDMNAALAGSRAAEMLRHGVKVALVGKPNTGKSSLLNALARKEAALVSPLAGTTRDVIEVPLDLGGIPVILCDMAGLRENASDEVEAAGVRKARREVAEADLLIWVWSADISGSDVPDASIEPDIVVRGKADLRPADSIRRRNEPGSAASVEVSARTGTGIACLLNAISGLAKLKISGCESVVVTNQRQREALESTVREIGFALESRIDRLELKAECIRAAAEGIGRITGRIDVEEWLGAIFSRFCVGK